MITFQQFGGFFFCRILCAQLYSTSLVYGRGDYFLSHRDTQRYPGHIATLVVTLPATRERHVGGELLIGRKVYRGADMTFCAFFCDVPHQIG